MRPHEDNAKSRSGRPRFAVFAFRGLRAEAVPPGAGAPRPQRRRAGTGGAAAGTDAAARRRPRRRSAPPVDMAACASPPRASRRSDRRAARRVHDGTAFLRSPDNVFILFPNGRLQIDGYSFKTDNTTPTEHVPPPARAPRARAAGSDNLVYFSIAGDFAAGAPAGAAPVAQTNLATTDDFVAIAPWGNLGDPPGRPVRRALHAREPHVGQVLRLHGALDHRARRSASPTTRRSGRWCTASTTRRTSTTRSASSTATARTSATSTTTSTSWGAAGSRRFRSWATGRCTTATIGGSFWTGDRSNTLPLANQTTQGGFTFLSFARSTRCDGDGGRRRSSARSADMYAAAGELNAPIAHKYGARCELVWKHNPLSVDTIASNGSGDDPGRRGSAGLVDVRPALVLGARRRSDHRRPAGPASRSRASRSSASSRRRRASCWRRGSSTSTRSSTCDADTRGADAAELRARDDQGDVVRSWASTTGTRSGSARPPTTSSTTSAATRRSSRASSSKNEQEFLFRLAIAL